MVLFGGDSGSQQPAPRLAARMVFGNGAVCAVAVIRKKNRPEELDGRHGRLSIRFRDWLQEYLARVDTHADCLHIGLQAHEPLPQFVEGGGEQVEIIHIASIVPAAQLPTDEPIQVVEKDVAVEL